MMRLLCVALLLVGTTTIAFAQAYPQRAVRIVVASTPGSSPDVVARLLAQKLTRQNGLTEGGPPP